MMKTNGKTFKTIIATVLLCSMVSCISTRYAVTTKINRDGSCLREIYAKGDSEFLSGDLSHNPYMFRLDSGWRIIPLDIAGKQKKYNVKTGKTAGAVEEYSAALQFDENMKPLAAPVETFQKRFRWFYTYCSFKAVYPCISKKIPVTIDNYMNREEQKLWFRGDFSAYPGMTGLELKNEMDRMEDQFMAWYERNIYEVYFNVVYDFERQTENGGYALLLHAARDTVFQTVKSENAPEVSNIVDLNSALDKYFKTTHFSDSYKENKQQIDRMCEEYLPENLFSTEIEYRLTVPGKLVNTNAATVNQDTLTWKITALHLIPGDYELSATSHTVNIWAFAAVFALIALSGYCLIKVRRNRRISTSIL
jgi:hypothetical protein